MNTQFHNTFWSKEWIYNNIIGPLRGIEAQHFMLTNIHFINTQSSPLALLETAYWVWGQASIWEGVWLKKAEWGSQEAEAVWQGCYGRVSWCCSALHEKTQASKAGLYRARSQHAKWVTEQRNVMDVLIARQAFTARPALHRYLWTNTSAA